MVKPLTVWITANCDLQEMGIPDILTCLLRNLFVGHLLEALAVRRGSRRPEALAEGTAQPDADDGRTPMDCALGGYRVAPTATHSDSAKPTASPDRTPW